MNLLKIESLNCRGLRDLKKRNDILDDFKKRNVNIVHLQETHLIASDLSTLKKSWNCKFLISGENKKSMGVVTIINNNFEYKIHMVEKDKGGRYIITDMEIPGIARFLMLNIYGQNQDRPEFLLEILDKLENNMIRNWILCGDWNLVLDQKLDTHNYLHINNPAASESLKSFIKRNNLIDIWRINNPDKKKFSWFRPSPVKAARLDYFIISPSILDLYADSFISFKYRSDHCKVGLTLHIDKSIKGKGIWKLNAELLNNIELMEKVEEGISLMVEIHACTPYNPNYVKNFDKNEITFMTPIDVFWEVLLTHLRGIFISHAARLKREKSNRETKLIKELENLNDLFNLDITDTQICKMIQDKSQELETLRELRLKGSFVRSRLKDCTLGERPNKFFLNLENYNFVSKNIKELLLDDGKNITKPEAILEEMRRFYQSLYDFKPIKNIEDSELVEFSRNFNKLNENEKMALDREISEEELRKQIFNSPSNKSPGPDGYTNEFYKALWNKLKVLLLSLMNHFFKEKSISPNHLMGIITCIPKGDKIRNKLKNWRPITLLNSIYKFYSGIWANRIKQHLPKLIGENQTGFVQNRFIGENTRLTWDILTESKFENSSGLLILIDFEKAFDSISWEFIEKILALFNFSPQTIQVIKSLQKNSFSKIIQNGHSSEIIRLHRGCRQGDPISPYIFVLAVELLGESIRAHKSIQGYKIKNREHRVSQFADDTTLFISRSERNLRLCMTLLEEFYLVSGLKINVDKTKVVKFGADRDSRDILCPDLNLIWTDTFTSLGIDYDVNHLDKITELNIEPKISEIDKLIGIWQSRNLTLIGKITLIKSLFISKFIHILLSLPSPQDNLFDKIDSLFIKFLWNGKPAKFSKKILEKQIADGGLQYPNIKYIDATMKLSWFKRLYKTNEGWAALPCTYGMDLIYKYGDLYLQKLLINTKNQFWKDTMRSLLLLLNQQIFHGTEAVLATPIWYNSNILPGKINAWIEKGITTIGDILGEDGELRSMDDIISTWNVKCDFLLHMRLNNKIKNFIKQKTSKDSCIFPQLSHVLYNIEISNKGNKNTYINIMSKDHFSVSNLKDKWSERLNEDITINTLQMAFKIAKKTTLSAYQYCNQFKLIHRRTVHNRLLKKMNIVESENCLFCKDQVETIEHIYISCANSANLWQDTLTWVRNIYDHQFIISDQEKIFGCSHGNQVANIIITSVKDVIYQKRKEGKNMQITDVKRCLLKNLNIIRAKAIQLDGLTDFEDKWDPFITDLRADILLRKSWYII